MSQPSNGGRRVRRADRWSGLLLLLFGLYILFEAAQLKFGSIVRPGPGFFPVVLAVLLVVVAAALVVNASRGASAEVVAEFGERTGHIALTVGAVIAYALVLERLGFLICTTAMLLMLLRGIGRLAWTRSVLIALGATVVSYYLFRRLGIPLPQGLLPL